MGYLLVGQVHMTCINIELIDSSGEARKPIDTFGKTHFHVIVKLHWCVGICAAIEEEKLWLYLAFTVVKEAFIKLDNLIRFVVCHIQDVLNG